METERKIVVDGFEYIIPKKAKVIGLIAQGKDCFPIIIKTQEAFFDIVSCINGGKK